MTLIRKRLDPVTDAAAVPRRLLARPVVEVPVGERSTRWGGAERALPARDRRGGGVAAAWTPSALQRTVDGALGEDFVVLARVGGPHLPITSAVGLARQLRRALRSWAPDAAAVAASHLAVVPLPAVVGPRPDGALLGIALVLRRELGDRARAAVLRALARLEDRHRIGGEAPRIALPLGEAGELVLQRSDDGALPDVRSDVLSAVLRPATWSGAARRWVTATPIALALPAGEPGHADPARQRGAREAVAAAVRRLGLPAPVRVDVLRWSPLPGTAEPRRYPRFPIDPTGLRPAPRAEPAGSPPRDPLTRIDPRRPEHVLVHARLRFGEPVRGPLLVGAGRHHGLGLLLPVDGRAPTW